MKERSYTVRVHTHPEAWGSKDFLAARTFASKLPIDATQFNHSIQSSFVCALPLPDKFDEHVRSIPRTCTVGRHSAYSISTDVIKRVICEPISQVVAHSPTCEIA
jgi:hypothetical protein